MVTWIKIYSEVDSDETSRWYRVRGRKRRVVVSHGLSYDVSKTTETRMAGKGKNSEVRARWGNMMERRKENTYLYRSRNGETKGDFEGLKLSSLTKSHWSQSSIKRSQKVSVSQSLTKSQVSWDFPFHVCPPTQRTRWALIIILFNWWWDPFWLIDNPSANL